jgi:hypothetical protein
MLLSRSPLRGAMRTLVRPASLLTCNLLVFLTTAGALRAQIPTPAAYLKFDEGAGTVAADSSGNNNNATLLGNAGWAAGIVGPFRS